MKPTETIDLRADLKTKVDNYRYAKHLEQHLLYDFAGVPHQNVPSETIRLAETCVVAAQRAAAFGENFFVSTDMCELVEFSARMLDATDTCDIKLMPSKSGFCVFEKPLEITDVRGTVLKINAILWCLVVEKSGGLRALVHMWNDEYRTPDEAAEFNMHSEADRLERMEIIGRWGYIGMWPYDDGEPLKDELTDLSEEVARRYEYEGLEPQPVTNIARLVHALWLMLGQTIVRSDKEEGDKRQERSMKWMDLPNEVTVIQLRRTESKPREGESIVEWKHRWITRGHWRWQPYKDETGEWIRKRIWIHAFIKGPTDKPLILTKKVNALVR